MNSLGMGRSSILVTLMPQRSPIALTWGSSEMISDACAVMAIATIWRSNLTLVHGASVRPSRLSPAAMAVDVLIPSSTAAAASKDSTQNQTEPFNCANKSLIWFGVILTMISLRTGVGMRI